MNKTIHKDIGTGESIYQEGSNMYKIDNLGRTVKCDMYGKEIDNSYYPSSSTSNDNSSLVWYYILFGGPIRATISTICIGLIVLGPFYKFMDTFLEFVFQFSLFFIILPIWPTIRLIKSKKNKIINRGAKRRILADEKKVLSANTLVYALCVINISKITGIDYANYNPLRIIMTFNFAPLYLILKGYFLGAYLLVSLNHKRPASLIQYRNFLLKKDDEVFTVDM